MRRLSHPCGLHNGEMAEEVHLAAEPPDSALAVELLGRYYSELDARFPGGFALERAVPVPAEEFAGPNGAFLVARVGDEPVGCGALRKLEEGVAEVKHMWVDPSARGRGVGRRLLAAVEEQAADLGCGLVRLDTSAYLPEAVALYKASGYREIHAYNDNPYAAHWFEKQL